ncbi:membrane protein insertion efficiency factor YidD [Demequina globuliformis]|uniref:membrane protein insertion efficiency factor YidD n=1 Tax=Demequina globuliformis TaxID=676202 RepID=UPI0007804856|nr:membrane protein insertion efficiency factor YidD [Demequina globuliformis]
MTGRQLWDAVRHLPSLVLVAMIRAYQVAISPLLGQRCKYYPSCSHYGLEAVRVHGAVIGPVLAAWRILRCNPWSYGGVDDVPAKGGPLFARRNETSHETPVSLSTP